MRVQEPGEAEPVSWLTIRSETPVFSSDGEEVGNIHEVLGSEQEDIFHGIVVRSGLLGKDAMVPAEHVTHMSDQRIDLSLSAEDMRALEPFKEEESYHVGIVGIFRRKLGWVSEGRDPE